MKLENEQKIFKHNGKKFFQKLAMKLDRPVTLEYANNYLRSKGIATNIDEENTLTFKLYDMDWDLAIRENQFGLRKSFVIGPEINRECIMRSTNKLNYEYWGVKSVIQSFKPDDENEEEVTFLYFLFEDFCYSESAFEKIYEFAIYAIKESIECYCKLYDQYLNELTTQEKPKIGFRVDSETKEGAVVDKKPRRKIGFAE